MSRNLNKNKEVSLTLYLIEALDPLFFESLIDTLGISNDILFTSNSGLTNYFKNIIFLNILSTEIISNQLDLKLDGAKTGNNLIYKITKQLNSSKLFHKDIKNQLEKFLFFNLKNTKNNCLLSSETPKLIKNLKNFILI